ncbi:hypothetical protein PENTCL1PPCAC_15987, partial [Pristionchus entomophagus]
MTLVEQSQTCLACGIPVNEIHLGIDCCRSCSVFYKRSLHRKRVLHCKEDDDNCLSRDPNTKCRKCRFERISALLTSSEGNSMDDILKVNSRNRSIVGIIAQPETIGNVFLDHETLMLCASTSSETPTLDRMRRAYGILCIMRKNGEMGTCSTQIFDQFQRGTINFARATYATLIPNERIMYTGLLDFFSSSFDDFKKLSKKEQGSLVIGNYDLLNKTDNLYRAVHHFPDDQTIMPNYTTIFSADRVDEFFVDCPLSVNKEEAAAEIIKNTTRHLVVNKTHFKRVQLAGEEFLALLALALWNEHSSNIDEKMAAIVKKNRSIITTELHKYYVTRGVANYAERLGDVLCLLVNMQEAAAQQKEDEQVYQL